MNDYYAMYNRRALGTCPMVVVTLYRPQQVVSYHAVDKHTDRDRTHALADGGRACVTPARRAPVRWRTVRVLLHHCVRPAGLLCLFSRRRPSTRHPNVSLVFTVSVVFVEIAVLHSTAGKYTLVYDMIISTVYIRSTSSFAHCPRDFSAARSCSRLDRFRRDYTYDVVVTSSACDVTCPFFLIPEIFAPLDSRRCLRYNLK